MRTQQKSNLSLGKLILIGSAASILFLLAGVKVFNLLAPETKTISLLPNQEDRITKKLLGRWEAEIEGDKSVLIFKDREKLVFTKNSEEEEAEGIESTYKINTSVKPIEFDINIDNANLLTIIDFVNKNEFKMAVDFAERQIRPTTFEKDTNEDTSKYIIPWKKVSDATDIPPEITVMSVDDINKRGQEAEAKNNLGALGRAQQAFHFESVRFTSNINELGIVPDEDNYTFDIQMITNNQVKILAIPKIDGIKSFASGVIFSPSSDSYNIVMCASDEPTKNAPSLQIRSGSFQCPSDSSKLH
jgi:Type IV pilin-like G and H, putative